MVQGTNAKQTRAWNRYKSYLISIGISNDWYLDAFNIGQKHRLLSSFAHAVREGRFSNPNHNSAIKSETVRATLDCVAQTYKLADRADPRLDTDTRFAFILQHQLRGYHVNDKPTLPQAAVTGSILREFHKISISQVDKTLCELFIGAFFFAMRSCEYLKVSGQRKTKILCIRNIRFFNGKRQLSHSDHLLHLADSVSITFEHQKKDVKNDIITHHRSGDKLLCPVNTFLLQNGNLHLFTGPELLKRLRMATMAIGPNILGFTAKQIWTTFCEERSGYGNVPRRGPCVYHHASWSLVKRCLSKIH